MSTEETGNTLATNIGNIILGGGIITALYLISPVPILELVQYAAFVLLPILCLAFAFGLISMGTLKLIWNQGLVAKVQKHVEAERANRQKGRYTEAGHNAA